MASNASEIPTIRESDYDYILSDYRHPIEIDFSENFYKPQKGNLDLSDSKAIERARKWPIDPIFIILKNSDVQTIPPLPQGLEIFDASGAKYLREIRNLPTSLQTLCLQGSGVNSVILRNPGELAQLHLIPVENLQTLDISGIQVEQIPDLRKYIQLSCLKMQGVKNLASIDPKLLPEREIEIDLSDSEIEQYPFISNAKLNLCGTKNLRIRPEDFELGVLRQKPETLDHLLAFNDTAASYKDSNELGKLLSPRALSNLDKIFTENAMPALIRETYGTEQIKQSFDIRFSAFENADMEPSEVEQNDKIESILLDWRRQVDPSFTLADEEHFQNKYKTALEMHPSIQELSSVAILELETYRRLASENAIHLPEHLSDGKILWNYDNFCRHGGFEKFYEEFCNAAIENHQQYKQDFQTAKNKNDNLSFQKELEKIRLHFHDTLNLDSFELNDRSSRSRSGFGNRDWEDSSRNEKRKLLRGNKAWSDFVKSCIGDGASGTFYINKEAELKILANASPYRLKELGKSNITKLIIQNLDLISVPHMSRWLKEAFPNITVLRLDYCKVIDDFPIELLPKKISLIDARESIMPEPLQRKFTERFGEDNVRFSDRGKQMDYYHNFIRTQNGPERKRILDFLAGESGTLDLRNLGIERIDPKMLFMLSEKAEHLLLSGNQLKMVDFGDFRFFEKMQKITFQGNPLEEILNPHEIPSSLTTLDLSNTCLRLLPNFAPKLSPSVKTKDGKLLEILLDECDLTEFTKNVVIPLANMHAVGEIVYRHPSARAPISEMRQEMERVDKQFKDLQNNPKKESIPNFDEMVANFDAEKTKLAQHDHACALMEALSWRSTSEQPGPSMKYYCTVVAALSAIFTKAHAQREIPKQASIRMQMHPDYATCDIALKCASMIASIVPLPGAAVAAHVLREAASRLLGKLSDQKVQELSGISRYVSPDVEKHFILGAAAYMTCITTEHERWREKNSPARAPLRYLNIAQKSNKIDVEQLALDDAASLTNDIAAGKHLNNKQQMLSPSETISASMKCWARRISEKPLWRDCFLLPQEPIDLSVTRSMLTSMRTIIGQNEQLNTMRAEIATLREYGKKNSRSLRKIERTLGLPLSYHPDSPQNTPPASPSVPSSILEDPSLLQQEEQKVSDDPRARQKPISTPPPAVSR